MSLFTAPLVFLYSTFAVAQVFAPNCSGTTDWEWSYNSLDQSPCLVAAYMLSTCNNGTFKIGAWEQQTQTQYLPSTNAQRIDLCYCNSVSYSLLSACAACQEGHWHSWQVYSANCSIKFPISTFPNPTPTETIVPGWAHDFTNSWGTWNPQQAQVFAVGGPSSLASNSTSNVATSTSNMAAPTSNKATSTSNTATSTLNTNGSTLNPDASTLNTAVSALNTASTSNAATPTSNTATPIVNVVEQSSNVGVIAGGIVGGIATISIFVSVLFVYRRRRSSQAPFALLSGGPGVFDSHMDQVQRPTSGQETVTSSLRETRTSLPYILDDHASTFSDDQGAPNLMYFAV